MPTIRPRSSWTSTPVAWTQFPSRRLNPALIHTLAPHYPAIPRAIGVLTPAQEEAWMRTIRSWHVDGNGWADIGYALGIFQSGRIYMAGGLTHATAHAGTMNWESIGVLFMVGNNEQPTQAAIDSFNALGPWIKSSQGFSNMTTVRDHGRLRGQSTQCAGQPIRRLVDNGTLHLRSTVTARSDLGWDVPSGGWVSRVGPHAANSSNPRTIQFRNHDVADLQAGAMWLVNSGNGNLADAHYVSEWHGRRPLGQGPTALSDHHAGVAADINWSVHPWEVRMTPAQYDRHISAHPRWHNMFAAIEARLTPRGARAVLRWCGRSWVTDSTAPHGGGWTAYARGRRDCMHWVMGTRNSTLIRNAANALRAWFVPPRTAAEIAAVQRVIGVTDDGQFGPGSVRAMYAWEQANGLTPTGLPGTVAFWRVANRRPDPQVERLQTLLRDFGFNIDVDGSRGPATDEAVRGFVRLDGYTGSTDTPSLLTYMEALMSNLMNKTDDILARVARIERRQHEYQLKHEDQYRALGRVEQAVGSIVEGVVTAIFRRPSFGRSFDWWTRRGLVPDPAHRAFPADPGSPADKELRREALAREDNIATIDTAEGMLRVQLNPDTDTFDLVEG